MAPTLPELAFENRFAQLPEALYIRHQPAPVSAPELMAFNAPLGQRLGLDRQSVGDDVLKILLSGNATPPGSEPLAAAYAGHQFGQWSGVLGDGRAVLLGELNASDGQHWDIQLKGSGPTPFSRGGDGRAWLGPVIREYILSNAMVHYGIPSTIALAIVATGDFVLREEGPLPGAVLTRVAKSHIRVGTFEYLAAKRDANTMRTLVDHLVEHHYPELIEHDNRALALLQAVIKKQAVLIAKWQSLGFIHGVMNTDNASMVGDTIDYGPCAFMDEFDRAKVFSSIDVQGRYAYQNQPGIGHWNMAMFAQAILPLLSDDESQAIAFAQAAVDEFPKQYMQAYIGNMREKFGLFDEIQDNDTTLMENFLDLAQTHSIDFTLGFRALSEPTSDSLLKLFDDKAGILSWYEQWSERLEGKHDWGRMQRVNPAIIPRNHWVEATIQAAVDGDWTLFHEFENALQSPFTENAKFSQPPAANERVQATFCGT